MTTRTFCGTFLPVLIALFSSSVGATLSSGDFMAQLQQAASDASSAVPPLRMRDKVAPRVLAGKFDGDAIDSIVITENGTAFCKGVKPDPRTCVSINGLSSSGRTVAVNDENGRTVLLQFDSPTMAQVCSVNAKGFRASLDCRALDARKFPQHRAQQSPDGKALLVDGTDGKYLCLEAGGVPRCGRILDERGQQLERQKPKLKQSLNDWRVVSVLRYQDDLEIDYAFSNALEAHADYMDGEINRDCYWGTCENQSWWLDRIMLYPPGPDRDRCLDNCQRKKDAAESMCWAAAGVACIGGASRGAAGCAAAGGAVAAACYGGVGIGDMNCRARCYN